MFKLNEIKWQWDLFAFQYNQVKMKTVQYLNNLILKEIFLIRISAFEISKQNNRQGPLQKRKLNSTILDKTFVSAKTIDF